MSAELQQTVEDALNFHLDYLVNLPATLCKGYCMEYHDQGFVWIGKYLYIIEMEWYYMEGDEFFPDIVFSSNTDEDVSYILSYDHKTLAYKKEKVSYDGR